MRTNLHSGRIAVAATLVLAAVLAFAVPAAPEEGSAASSPAPPPVQDRIFSAHVQAGYQAYDTDGSLVYLFPYDPLTSGPVFGFDLLYITPAFGTLDLGAAYLDKDLWSAEAEYHRGAEFDLHVGARETPHALEHRALHPDLDVPNPNIDAATGLPYDPIEVVGRDADPDAEYSVTRRETEASLKLRAPGYPAHFRASGRVVDKRGTQQMFTHYRSCGTHLCHVDSRTRETDQRTEELSLGADAHLGPLDLAYTHARRTFRDRAPDPVDYFEDSAGTLMTYPPTGAFYPPGDYVHDVNPDIKSFSNLVKLNTNLANRTVLSLYWRGEEQENEYSGITRGTQRAEATAGHTFSREWFASLRLAWQHEETLELSDTARKLRTDNNKNHLGQSHQHVVEPDDTQRSAELLLRWEPVPKAQLLARVRAGDRERHALIEKVGTSFVDEPLTTRETLARLEGRYRAGTGLTLNANLGQEWTDDPAYATETTSLTRFGAGAVWAVSPLLSLQASYQGYRGENDDRDALTAAYDAPRSEPLLRSVDGNALSVAAVLTPAEALSITATWLLSDNGIDQDLILGAFSPPGFAYYSPDTSWEGKTQTVSLRAAWAASKRLTLTADGVWIDARESYAPTFPQGAGLEEIGTVEFTKLLATIEADVRLTERIGLTLSGTWADYDDRQDDANDGSALGVLAAVDLRW